MNRLLIIITIFALVNILTAEKAAAQQYASFAFVSDSINSHSIKFKEINNLVLIPLSFNNSDTLYFILDSGAENITLFGAEFDEAPIDTSQLRRVNVAGGGEELLEAFVSPINRIQAGPIVGKSLNIIYIPNDFVKFSDLLGHPVHGILGIQIFHSFAVKLDYYKREVTFIDLDHFKPKRRFSQMPLHIKDGRPFIDLFIEIHPKINMTTNLLVDLGESKPMSLFLSTNEAFILPYPNYYANLGKGLSGMVTGRVARINSITIDKFILKNVITAFPDQDAIQFLTGTSQRNGSLGAGILKRFVTIFDLSNSILYLKRSGLIRQPFSYDKTGLIIVAEGENFDRFNISGVILDSPADKAGIRQGDVISAINGNSVEGLKLGEIFRLIEDGGRKIHIDILRDGDLLEYRMKIFRVL